MLALMLLTFGLFVRNGNVEFFFEFHDQFNGVEAVGTEILDEARIVGQLLALDAKLLFDDVALVPLGQTTVFGLLALGSEDPKRFYPDMGTLYLRRIGELCAAGVTAAGRSRA